MGMFVAVSFVTPFPLEIAIDPRRLGEFDVKIC